MKLEDFVSGMGTLVVNPYITYKKVYRFSTFSIVAKSYVF